jgi:hypothetical protein
MTHNKLYTMPREGNTQAGDEFIHPLTGMWMNIPPESIGQPVNGWIIRREYVPEPDAAMREAIATVGEIERITASIGVKFSVPRESLMAESKPECEGCIAGEPWKNPPPPPSLPIRNINTPVDTVVGGDTFEEVNNALE